jgi:hypothetical protein
MPPPTQHRSLPRLGMNRGPVTRTHNAHMFLTGVVLMPIGWVLALTSGSRASRQEFRNDEDVYTLLEMSGSFLMLLGATLVLVSLFRALRKIDRLVEPSSGPSSTASAPADPPPPVST